MLRLLFGLTLVFTILIQATIIPQLNPLPVSPDIAMVLLLFFFARHGLRTSLVWALLAGMFIDLVAMDTLGIHALALMPLVLLARPMITRPWRFDVFIATGLTLAGAVLYGVTLSLLRGSLPGRPLAWEVAMQTVLAPLIFLIYRALTNRRRHHHPT